MSYARYLGLTANQLAKMASELESENAKLREALAISVPLPLDDNCCAVHPDDVIGYNVDGKDIFWKVKEMRLTRYPKKGQPVLWVVHTVDDDGRESPYVCWGGRCRAVHKVSAQTYSPEYLEVYDENEQLKAENKQLKAENAKLRELCKAWRKFSYELFDEFIADPETSYDFMELDDRLRELGIEVASV